MLLFIILITIGYYLEKEYNKEIVKDAIKEIKINNENINK